MGRLIALLLLMIPVATAQQQAHLIAFNEGRYADAARVAETSPTADNMVFAARSLLAEAMSAPDHIPPPYQIEQAERLAREALKLEPEHIEGRLQLAIALSLRARPMSTREAMRSGLGDEAKRLAESVLRDDPLNQYANGFMAVWNIEVRRRGGSLGASIMGASIDKARQHYSAALQNGDADASTHWQYARALAALDSRRHKTEIDAALHAALARRATSRLEHVMQSRAAELKTVLATQSRREAEQRAADML